MKPYNPAKWYWYVGGDTARAFSTVTLSYVPSDDPSFSAWLADGSIASAVASEDDLFQVLEDAGVPPYAPVTPRQARLALLAAGLLDQVESAVNTAGGATKLTWDYATQVRRKDPLITQIGASLNLTAAQIDALFVYAAKQ